MSVALACIKSKEEIDATSMKSFFCWSKALIWR
jgi:hypothetical protein